MKKVTKVAKKVAKPVDNSPIFYTNKDKYERACILFGEKKFKSIKEAYVSLGGGFADHGWAEVK